MPDIILLTIETYSGARTPVDISNGGIVTEKLLEDIFDGVMDGV